MTRSKLLSVDTVASSHVPVRRDFDFEDLAVFSAARRMLLWKWQKGPSALPQFATRGDAAS